MTQNSLARVALLSVLLAGASARADGLEQAQVQLSKGYSDLYNSIKSNPTMSREQMYSLSRQKIDGPTAEVGKAMNQNAQETATKYGLNKKPDTRKPEPDPSFRDNPDSFKDAFKAFAKGGPKGGTDQAVKTVAGSKGVADPGPSKPELVLDGKDVPKEVEFPGKRPAKKAQ